MIDFRYHLVSLVSVFLALAIGVVLGAGPLRGPLSDTLQSQVSALRQDKENLQKAVNNRDQTIGHQDTALQELATPAVAGQLANRQVTLVVLPGAKSEGPSGWADLLQASGATVASTVTITPAWSNPALASPRTDAVTALASQTGQLGLPADAREQTKLSALLARAISSTTSQARDQVGKDILTELTGANLVSVSEDSPVRGDLVVVLEPAPDDGAAGSDSKWRTAELAVGTELVSALDSSSAATVVAGPGEGKGTLVGQVRGGSLASTVSTVDDLDSGMAAPSTVLALIQQLAGGVGQYGTGQNVTALMPPVPSAPATSATPTSSATP